MSEFEAYNVGIVNASVCTSLPLKEATKRLNEEHPTGISSQWSKSESKTFSGGEPNPCKCKDNPKNKHWLFSC